MIVRIYGSSLSEYKKRYFTVRNISGSSMMWNCILFKSYSSYVTASYKAERKRKV